MKGSHALALLALAGAFFVQPAADAAAQQRLAVKVTNLTRSQVITPPVVVTHVPAASLFTLGRAARPELVKLAEDGDTTDLEALLGSGSPLVGDYAVASEPVMPGGTVTVEVFADQARSSISVAGMLATSNDAFFAVRNGEVPRSGALTLYGVAYDAGSETNSESCASIPGPPCMNPMVRDTAGAEGYVHVHPGIHGIGDLDPALYDWRNPVAEVTITALP